MKKTSGKSAKGEATRAHIFETALGLFRRRGFERTTMRDIAAAAELSLGAAYHYFTSKEEIVLAYYEWTQEEHARRAGEALARVTDLRTRLEILFGTKLDVLEKDRKLLAALFGDAGDPSHPLSVFSKRTRTVRQESLAQFESALAGATVPEELRPVLPRLLWLLHLAVLIFFIHDRSPKQARTRKLIDGLLDMVMGLLAISRLPIATPILSRALALLAELGLGEEEPS